MRSTVFAVVGLMACGGGGGSGGITVDNLAAELGEVTCEKLSACCTPQEFMDETLGADTVAECQALFTGFGTILTNVMQDSIAAGRMIYHGDRMADCFAAIESASCIDFRTQQSGPFPGSACEDPFEGLVADGGQCANDFDCRSEFCSGDSVDFNGNVTFGTCGVAPAIGQPCDGDDCAEGAFCDFGPSGQTCTALLTDGSACNGDDECASGGCNGTPGTCGVTTTCDGN